MGKPLSCHTLQVIFSAGLFYNRNQVIKQTTDKKTRLVQFSHPSPSAMPQGISLCNDLP